MESQEKSLRTVGCGPTYPLHIQTKKIRRCGNLGQFSWQEDIGWGWDSTSLKDDVFIYCLSATKIVKSHIYIRGGQF